MSNIFEYKGYRPVIDVTSFIHPNCTIEGNVIIGAGCYMGAHCVIRGDIGGIIIGDGCNVQENCVVHMFPAITVRIGENAHIGHGAIIHGATIGRDTMIGMNAVVMDGAVVGDESIVGAMCFVPANMKIPNRKLAVGIPAEIIKDVTDEMFSWKVRGTELYHQLAETHKDRMNPCDPLREPVEGRELDDMGYKIWADVKNSGS